MNHTHSTNSRQREGRINKTNRTSKLHCIFY